jgi:hypothetical protein
MVSAYHVHMFMHGTFASYGTAGMMIWNSRGSGLSTSTSPCTSVDCLYTEPGVYQSEFSFGDPTCAAISNKSYEILWDTGATFSVSPFLSDFVDEPKFLGKNQTLRGVQNNVVIEGVGTVDFTVWDSAGELFVIRSAAYYLPKSNRRIFSLQAFMSENPSSYSSQRSNGIKFSTWIHSIFIPNHGSNNLPIFMPLMLLVKSMWLVSLMKKT